MLVVVGCDTIAGTGFTGSELTTFGGTDFTGVLVGELFYTLLILTYCCADEFPVPFLFIVFVRTGFARVLDRGAGVYSLPLRTQVELFYGPRAAAPEATAPDIVRSCCRA